MATETETDTGDPDVGDGTAGTEEGAVETGGGISDFMRSITVTTTATLLGLGAGVLSMALASGPNDLYALAFLALAILVQFPLYKIVGIDTGDFGTKDKLYIGFMTFSLWFISWSILMTAGSLQ